MNPSKLLLRRFLDKIDPWFSRVFLSWIIRHPRYMRTAIRLMRSFQHAKRMRDVQSSKGVRIPPVLILSITSKCNLVCSGCYAAATKTVHNGRTDGQLNLQKWNDIISQACELGVFGFVIAGGEPFLFPGLIDLCMQFKDRFFLIVTNGTAIREDDFKLLEKASNLAIIVSLEGGPIETDLRRGSGVYERALKTLQRLWNAGVLTGISATITQKNYDYWIQHQHLDWFVAQGLRIAVFIEYIPDTPETLSAKQSLSSCSDFSSAPTKEERDRFRTFVLNYRSNNPLLIMHSPTDEMYFGGCVSAGRGFAHVTPTGDLTACPVSSISTHNLQTSTLKEGLGSLLFKLIRKNQELHVTDEIPCALRAHPKEMASLAKATGARWAEYAEVHDI